MDLSSEFKESTSRVETELKSAANDSITPHVTFDDLCLSLGRISFTRDASSLRAHSEMIAKEPSLLPIYIDIVLASRNVHDDPQHDRAITTAASNAISVLNYGSRSGVFPFHFIDVRDWSGIRVPDANLNYAFMAHCNLDGADLSGASITNITLFGAQLRRTNLVGVKVPERTMFQTRSRVDRPDLGPLYFAVHPKGIIAASEGSDGAIRIFTLETDEDICSLDGHCHTSKICYLGFSRDGSYLSSASTNRELRIWNMTTYQCISCFQLDLLNIRSPGHVEFSPDNCNIVTVWNPTTIRVGNVETSQWTLTFKQERVLEVDWSPTSSYILSYSYDGDIRIWDTSTSACTVECKIEETNNCYARFTLDGRKVVVNVTSEIYIFDTTSGNRLATIPKQGTRDLRFGVDSRYVYVPVFTWIYVFDLETYERITRLTETSRSSYFFSVANGQKLITYCNESRMVRIYDVATLSVCAPTVTQENLRYQAFTFSPSNRYLVASYYGASGDLRFLDVRTGQTHRTASASGSRSQIYLLEYCPTGRFIASVTHLSSTITIYDVTRRRCVARLRKHVATVLRIAFNAQGTILASSAMNCDAYENEDGNILLWNTKTWKCRRLRGHTEQVEELCFSPEGNTLASASADKSIRVWNIITEQCVMIIDDDLKFSYAALSYSTCGRFLASLDSGCLRIWDSTEGKCLNTYTETSGRLWGDIRFLSNGRLAVMSKTYRIFDMFTGESIDLRFKVTDAQHHISFDGGLMATRSSMDSQDIYLWKFQNEPCKSRIVFRFSDETKPLPSLRALKVLPEEDGYIVTFMSDDDGSVHIHNGGWHDTPCVLQAHSDLVTCTDVSPNGLYLVSGSRDNTVRVWELAIKECIGVLEGHAGAVSCVQFSSDDRFIASGSYDTTIRLWSASECNCIGKFEGHTTPVKQLVFSPNNLILASIGLGSNEIHIWDIASRTCHRVLDQHPHEIFDIQFSSDSHYLASGSYDDSICVWETKTGECIATLKGHTDCLTCFVLSSDGKIVVSGSEDKTIRIWDVSTAECRFTLSGHTGHLRSLNLTPDDRCVISASSDRVIHIWDIATGAMLHQLIGHTAPITSVKLIHYDAEGTSTMVSTASDGTARLWSIDNMVSRIAYLPEMRSIVGAQDTMEFSGADVTDAVMESWFAKVIERYGAKLSQE